MKFFRTFLSGLVPALLFGPVASVTVSSVAVAATEEIITTARRREENLQEVPLSVTAIGAQQLEDRGVKSIEDIVALDPSVLVDQGFSAEDTRIAIRGLTNTRGRSNTAFLVDGVDVTSESADAPGASLLVSQRLLDDVERVDIVKGPQSALYGRAAFAGAFNYVTKNADLENREGRVALELADYNRWQVSGAYSTPIIPGLLAVRGQAVLWDGDGFYDNAASGRNLGGPEGWATALTFNLEPDDVTAIKWRTSLSSETNGQPPQVILQDQNRPCTLPDKRDCVLVQLEVPDQAKDIVDDSANPNTNDGPIAPADWVQFSPPTLGDVNDLAPQFRQPRASENPLTGEELDGSRISVFRTTLRVDREMWGGTVSYLGGYTNADTFIQQDVDYQAIGLPDQIVNNFVVDSKNNTKQLSQELRYASDFEGPVNFTTGVLGWRERRDFQTSNYIVTCLSNNPLCEPDDWQSVIRTLNPQRPEGGFFNAHTRHWSLYGLIEWQATDRLTVGVEGRYVDEFFGLERTLGTPCLLPFFRCDLPTFNFDIQSASKRSDFFTPKVTLDFQLTEDTLLYFSAGKGQKPAGISTLNSGAAAVIDSLAFDSEVLWAYEAGWKTSFDGAWGNLVFNGAVFFQDYKEKQVQVIRFDEILGAIPGIDNASSAEVFGQEIQLVWSPPIEGLTLNVGYTHLDTEFTDFVEDSSLALSIAETQSCTVSFRDPSNNMSPKICRVDRSGNELERAAPHAIVGLISYVRPFGDSGLEYSIEFDGVYQAERFTTQNNFTTIDDSRIYNLRLGLEAEDWKVVVFADNVFDDDTFVSGGTTAPDFGANFKIPPIINIATQLPDPRLVGIRFNRSFGGAN